jgi:DNA ligase D-like protein (predicted polymerase)
MRPHLVERPLVMERLPDGIAGEAFYQKQVGGHFPDWITTLRVRRKRGGSQELVVCDRKATLAYLADQACLTPHLWLSRRDRLDTPDQLVIDLDPPGRDFAPVRRAALYVKELLDELELFALVKTTGSRGLHVHLPLRREQEFSAVRAFARDLAALLVRRHPQQLTTAARKAARHGRVYLDVARNAYAQTAVAPYAVRAREGRARGGADPLGGAVALTARGTLVHAARRTAPARPRGSLGRHAPARPRARACAPEARAARSPFVDPARRAASPWRPGCSVVGTKRESASLPSGGRPMAGFETILVPHDFSEHSEAALRLAGDLAGQLGAKLHLLHVVRPFTVAYPAWSGAANAVAPETMAEIERGAARALREEAAKARGRDVEVHVVVGASVAGSIAELAGKLSADLIVMGTHGRTGIAHVFLGSSAERTLRTAPCPVLALRAPQT